MKTITHILVAIFITITSTSFADEISHKKAAAKLFELTMKPINFEQMQVDSTLNFYRGLRRIPIKTDKDKQKSALIEKTMERVVRKWSPYLKQQTGIITQKLYMQLYTENDLKELFELLNTKIGQKFLKNQQYLSTQIVKQIIPKTSGMTTELSFEIPKVLKEAGLE